MHSPSLSVLYVDHDLCLLDLCRLHLQKYGISITPASSVREALHLIKSARFDAILSDYQMPEINGIDFLKILKTEKSPVPVIIFTGRGDPGEVLIESLSNGAAYYIPKSGDRRTLFAELAEKIREVFRRSQTKESVRETELRYKTLFEYSGTAIITLDDNLMIVAANSGFGNLTGYCPDESEGILRWVDVVRDEDAKRLTEHIRLLRQGFALPGKEIAFHLVTKDHLVRPILATISLIPDTRWSIVSLIEIWRSPFCGELPCIKTRDSCSSPVNQVLAGNSKPVFTPVSVQKPGAPGDRQGDDRFPS